MSNRTLDVMYKCIYFLYGRKVGTPVEKIRVAAILYIYIIRTLDDVRRFEFEASVFVSLFGSYVVKRSQHPRQQRTHDTLATQSVGINRK